MDEQRFVINGNVAHEVAVPLDLLRKSDDPAVVFALAGFDYRCEEKNVKVAHANVVLSISAAVVTVQ